MLVNLSFSVMPRIDHGNDSDRDTGGNQAVFNSGSAKLVLQNAASFDMNQLLIGFGI